jgi:DNA replication protein DnaC
MSRIFNDKIKWECSKCNGLGWEVDELESIQSNNGINGRCHGCYFPNKFLDANIGYDYWVIDENNWEGAPEDLAQISGYFDKLDTLRSQGRGFYIFGPYGVGKTSLACLFLKMVLIRTQYSGLFVPFSELVMLNSKIVTGWHDKTIEDAINQIKNVDFLILDDLAKEYDNERDNGRATLNTILRYRDMWRKPTIYTANIPISAIPDKYGASNYSIIRGRSTIVTMTSHADFRIERKMRQELYDGV